jgi:hypothetical protein
MRIGKKMPAQNPAMRYFSRTLGWRWNYAEVEEEKVFGDIVSG